MRVAGLLLALITLLVLAPLAPAAQAPAPDAAPGAAPVPQPDPAPGAAPAPSTTSSPPPPAQPVQPAEPAPVEPATDLSAPAAPAAGEQPAPAPAPKQSPRRVEREKPASKPVPTPDQGLPILHLAASSASDASGPLARAGLALLLLVIVGAASLRLTLRMAGPLAVLVLVAAAPAAAQAVEPALSKQCSPAPADCSGWYRSEVRLAWAWDQFTAAVSAGQCNPTVFTTDTAGTETFCEVRDIASGDRTRKYTTIRIDRTPPTVTGAIPERPPDSNNWFNHPVSFTFQGSDATSGVASCSSGSFAGPEGEGVSVAGSCTDVAGNVSSAAFPLNYDSTRPAAPDTEVIPGDNLVRFDWSLPRGAVAVEVARVLPGQDEVVYAGRRSEVVDRGLKNGVRHRYRVTAVDRAGNRSSARESAVPTTADLLTPAAGQHLSEPPLLAWKQVDKASYYNVQLYRGRRKVLTQWPRTNRLQLKSRWRFAGRRQRLKAGRYTWYVWPGLGKRVELRYGRMLGKRTFTVTR